MGSRPFITVPYRRKRRRSQMRDSWFGPVMVAIPAAAFIAVFAFGGPPHSAALAVPRSSADRESASFPLCDGPLRTTCVVDGDTLWYRGAKIRIADINAPETSKPQCAHEAAQGRRAMRRLQVLLNSGPFTLAPNPDGRNTDKYGRSLRVITRGGQSLGGALVSEGLAEYWKGYRGSWC